MGIGTLLQKKKGLGSGMNMESGKKFIIKRIYSFE